MSTTEETDDREWPDLADNEVVLAHSGGMAGGRDAFHTRRCSVVERNTQWDVIDMVTARSKSLTHCQRCDPDATVDVSKHGSVSCPHCGGDTGNLASHLRNCEGLEQ